MICRVYIHSFRGTSSKAAKGFSSSVLHTSSNSLVMRLHVPIFPSLHTHACLDLATQTSSSSFLALGITTASCDIEDLIKPLGFFRDRMLSFKADISQSSKRSHGSRWGVPNPLKNPLLSPQMLRQCLIDGPSSFCSQLVWARMSQKIEIKVTSM